MTPQECPEKQGNIDNKKTFCIPWDKWTNCLEVGHCTYDPTVQEEETNEKDLRSA